LRTARKQPCVKKQHVWTLDRGRRCAVCDARRTRLPGTPKLVRLAYGSVYCELCRVNIGRGEPVAWWRVADSSTGRGRPAAYCAGCNHANVARGRPLR